MDEQDISSDELKYVNDFLAKEYITKKESIYKFNSKYRAGTLGLVQNGTAYLNVIGEYVRDLFIDDVETIKATEGDLVIAQRLLGKRGAPSAKIVEVVGRAQTYSVAYIVLKEGKKSLLDLKTDFPAGAEMSEEALLSYEDGDIFKVNNQDFTIMERLGNIKDPLVDEKIVLAQFNKHDEFSDEVLALASSLTLALAALASKE